MSAPWGESLYRIWGGGAACKLYGTAIRLYHVFTFTAPHFSIVQIHKERNILHQNQTFFSCVGTDLIELTVENKL